MIDIIGIFKTKRLIRKIERSQRALDKSFEESLNASVETLKEAEQDLLENVRVIVNVGQFTTICNFDMSILWQELLLARTKWRRRLYARLLSLVIVEYLEDISALLGKAFRSIIILLDEQSLGITRINTITKELTQLRTKHEVELRNIRNIAIGHRDHNTKNQLDLINKLDVASLEAITNDIMNWSDTLKTFLADLIKAITREPDKW